MRTSLRMLRRGTELIRRSAAFNLRQRKLRRPGALLLQSLKVTAAVVQEHADFERIPVGDRDVKSIILVELPDSNGVRI